MASDKTVPAGEAIVWMRMSDADLEKFGGPEWVGFDAGELYNTPASQLEAYEAEIGFFLHFLVGELLANGTRATRAALFIARRRAGVKDSEGKDERYAEFDPQTMQVVRRLTKPGSPADAGNGAVKAGRGKSRRATPLPDGLAAEASPPSSTSSAPA